jgi:hypothetical protein
MYYIYDFEKKEVCCCCSVLETRSHYVAETGLELLIVLPLSPELWDYRHAPPCLARKKVLKFLIWP